MDAGRLRMLRELADHGTVAAVAQVLSMTPSAVSQQLKILQREAGVTLIEPDGRRVRLTDAGQMLVGHADAVLAALDCARAEMDAYRTTPRGTVSVSFFPSGAAMLLAPLIIRSAERGVQVSGRDVDVPASRAPAQLADFDVVVVHRDERDASPWGPRFQATELLREPLDVVLPPGHRLAGHDQVQLTELAEEHWIGVEGGLMVDDVLNSIAILSGVSPRIIQRANDFRVVEELVHAGIGIALMPRYVVLARDLVRLPISDITVARRVEAITRAGAAARPAVAVVLDELAAIASDISSAAAERDRGRSTRPAPH
ncbi:MULTISPECIES: LysR family transcriptional regulator [unclassified Mycolicibacterium]|uniref:LysR family transcriptional regulator n=1 Tax=unclassified Mycolicibacterium TaxID=2636767 RepID=UPI0012DC644F|nr:MULTISPECIES: LysR family transcriptional regulator [unclassified Mycolicibacterium]MUL82487.1 LysR family transcriptional regulator [Mycolicibacterium sp. CBMA 329]MUL91381.1 LysR family transcriptional regulator [Mycolicibacterium sp. CBMA 331]MUM01504.1 LysR family transcriptional regulator [Mycolicibacterium sp. CBMA 334]MUM27431.1 LysR family transcriptional regulator [Mycolicibacterium sp. CBMA 295]MUM41805.1 LysR family transcriptional regulator [Mycolicibacterium sp. CBMA 247]